MDAEQREAARLAKRKEDEESARLRRAKAKAYLNHKGLDQGTGKDGTRAEVQKAMRLADNTLEQVHLRRMQQQDADGTGPRSAVPDGWSSATSPDGATYYYERSSGETAWLAPGMTRPSMSPLQQLQTGHAFPVPPPSVPPHAWPPGGPLRWQAALDPRTGALFFAQRSASLGGAAPRQIGEAVWGGVAGPRPGPRASTATCSGGATPSSWGGGVGAAPGSGPGARGTFGSGFGGAGQGGRAGDAAGGGAGQGTGFRFRMAPGRRGGRIGMPMGRGGGWRGRGGGGGAGNFRGTGRGRGRARDWDEGADGDGGARHRGGTSDEIDPMDPTGTGGKWTDGMEWPEKKKKRDESESVQASLEIGASHGSAEGRPDAGPSQPPPPPPAR